MIQKKRLHWIPVSVLLIGVLAASLLVWTDRIYEKLRINDLMLDALMDVQTHTATFHLWFEEALAGDPAVKLKEVWEDYDRAVRQVDALLKGGVTEHGYIPYPLMDPRHRTQAEGLKTLLADLQSLAMARLHDPGKAGIGSDLDSQFDKVFGTLLVKAKALELEVQAEQAGHREQTNRLLTGIMAVWIVIVVSAAWWLHTLERRRRTSQEALRTANERLRIQAEELTKHREHLAELIDMRTAELTSANRNLELEIRERVQAEEALKTSQTQLRSLSSKLITAQEEERRKISRELHDELGQSLTLVKFQLRSIEKQLQDDQVGLRDECEENLQYINEVIENVRRLSRDLCPLVLDDLGLTRALRWLVDSFTKTYGIRLDLNAEDIDCLCSKHDQTNIYRIVQEALTNIVKHSGAGSASVAVQRDGKKIVVSIEDDGKGFSPAEVRTSAERGLGLASMEERIGMLGGTLTLWSEKGKGTRLSFHLPVHEEKDHNELVSHYAG